MNYLLKSQEERLEVILCALEHAYETEKEFGDQDYSYESLLFRVKMDYMQPQEDEAGYFYADVRNILKYALKEGMIQ